MREIVIDDGKEQFALKNKNGDVFAEISFNPADTGFIARYNDAYASIFGEDMDGNTLDDIKNKDSKIIEAFDTLFECETKDKLFKVYSPCTVLGNGDFFFEVILTEIGKIMEETTEARVKARLDRIEKATAKYSKKK